MSSPLRGVTETQKERMIVFQLSFFRGRVVKLFQKVLLTLHGLWSAFFCGIRNIFQLLQRQNHATPFTNDERNMVSSFLLDMFWICFGYVLDMFWICFGYVLRTPKNFWSFPKYPPGSEIFHHLFRVRHPGDDTRSRSPRGSRILFGRRKTAPMCLVSYLGPPVVFFGNPFKKVSSVP